MYAVSYSERKNEHIMEEFIKKYLLLRMSFSTERILARVKYVTKKTVSENYEET